MKKVGITIDDWKETKFVKELHAQGFQNLTVSKFSKGVKLISVHVEEDKIETVRRLCVKLQSTIRRGDN
jgi:hypothetical protein